MVIRPANRDTKKRGEFVKGEKTDREGEEEGSAFRTLSFFFFEKPRRE